MLYVFSYRTLVVFLVALAWLAPELSYANTSALPPQQHVNSGVKSFREWKTAKLQDAELKVKILKEKIKPDVTQHSAQDPNLTKKNVTSEAGLSSELHDQLERELLNLSLTQDLSMTDYFVGYLTKQSSLDLAIRDLSTRLTPEEVAELMSAYAQNFFQTKPSLIKVAPRADSSQ